MEQELYLLTKEELKVRDLAIFMLGQRQQAYELKNIEFPEPLKTPTDEEISKKAHSLNLVTIHRWQSYYDGSQWMRDYILKQKH